MRVLLLPLLLALLPLPTLAAAPLDRLVLPA